MQPKDNKREEQRDPPPVSPPQDNRRRMLMHPPYYNDEMRYNPQHGYHQHHHYHHYGPYNSHFQQRAFSPHQSDPTTPGSHLMADEPLEEASSGSNQQHQQHLPEQQMDQFASPQTTFSIHPFAMINPGYTQYTPESPIPSVAASASHHRSDSWASSAADSKDSQSSPMQGSDVSFIPSGQVSRNDVICGRGAGSNTHPGNITFRSLIAEYQHEYYMAKPIEKANIAKGIVAEVQRTGGRFLKRSNQKNDNPSDRETYWYEISEKAAREKTCQALRERDDKAPKSRPTLKSAMHRHQITLANRSTSDSVNDNDVLFGRGGVTNSHVGNKRFRDLVRARQESYLASAKLEKSKVAMGIVTDIKGSGGRFLTEQRGEWVEVTDIKAREKTSQALREKAPEVRRKLRDESYEEGGDDDDHDKDILLHPLGGNDDPLAESFEPLPVDHVGDFSETDAALHFLKHDEDE